MAIPATFRKDHAISSCGVMIFWLLGHHAVQSANPESFTKTATLHSSSYRRGEKSFAIACLLPKALKPATLTGHLWLRVQLTFRRRKIT
ncbi:hypothetical protein Taro_006584, partial [Colocasia esculenta]|nr:hypothetical protein [Colocasia esculenta]